MAEPKVTVTPNKVIKSADLRKMLYPIVASVGALLTTTGVVTEEAWSNYVGIGGAVLSFLFLLLAFINSGVKVDFSDALAVGGETEESETAPSELNSDTMTRSNAAAYRAQFEEFKKEASSGD